MSAELNVLNEDTTSLGTTQFYQIQFNTTPGVKRLKSIHLDMVFSPASSATGPIVVSCGLHRYHEDLASSNLDRAEGTRVKYERLTVGRTTDRYFRMWLEQINLENGYELTLAVVPVDIVSGTPSFALGGRWWELVTD